MEGMEKKKPHLEKGHCPKELEDKVRKTEQ